MHLFKERESLQAYLSGLKARGKTIGFVPTMGALHAGHLSLIAAAAGRSDVVVCSIFVNPTQFNDPRDFEQYPVRTEEDIQKLLEAGADILFLPPVSEIYAGGTTGLPHFDFGPLESILEGASRPGHFQGVGQVMQQLLETVRPDLLFMGQKDMQQILIINKLKDLIHIKTDVVACPVMREADGLAMSSRNLRLSPEAREKAPAIYQALLFVKDHFREIPFPDLVKQATARLEQQGFDVEYVTIADSRDLQPLSHPAGDAMICLAAARIGGIRLIDNVFL